MENESKNVPEENECPLCGARFRCGMTSGQAVCWCMELPVACGLPETEGRCICPDCLGKQLSGGASPQA